MEIKQLYNQNINIQKYFRDLKGTNVNDINSILYSYDFQAGSYAREYLDEKIIEGIFAVDGKKVNMTKRQSVELQSKYIVEELSALHPKSILEVGVGEATSLCDIILNMEKNIQFSGLELSLSRLLYAQRFAAYKNVDIDFVMGNMFSLPYKDNAFDVTFMLHSLESNTGREKEALKELVRVAAKYVVMLEPSYELGNEETKKRIKDLGYIDNLQNAIKNLNLDIVKNELFRVTTYNNNTAITIIKKNSENQGSGSPSSMEKKAVYACPNCKTELHQHEEAYFCPECFNLYPVIQNIPILNVDNAILCSKYETESFN